LPAGLVARGEGVYRHSTMTMTAPTVKAARVPNIVAKLNFATIITKFSHKPSQTYCSS
jgi:hypothetical protein